MAFIGLSILIASLTFLCYRHPPSSWTFLPWLSETYLLRFLKVKTPLSLPPESAMPESSDIPLEEAIANHDFKDMPPPPPPPFVKQPAIVSKDQAPLLTGTSVAPNELTPTFTVDKPWPSLTTVPSFPALNSAQRASGGRGPPRLNPAPAVQSSLRSSSLMSPPMRSLLPNRALTTSSSLAIPPTHSSIPAKPSKKVLLTPGHSPLDWAHLSSRTDVDLRGLPPLTPYLRVPPSLLRKYTGRKGKDSWTVLGGKVYNITPYMPYHPGGVPELMKAVGRDGTKLFGEIHPWVNWEGMLERCLVGIAVGEEDVQVRSQLDDMD